jgi:hypothetical protein
LAGREERQYSQRDIKEAALVMLTHYIHRKERAKIKAASQGDILQFEVKLLKAVS